MARQPTLEPRWLAGLRTPEDGMRLTTRGGQDPAPTILGSSLEPSGTGNSSRDRDVVGGPQLCPESRDQTNV